MELSHSGYHYTITLQNEFRMSECINFRNTYEKVPTNAALTLDFQSVKAIDSSCVVMLMSLVQHFNNSEKVQIVNCSSDITDLFSNTTICNWLH
ncbi:STAS domain-containing protein [sulfur-oxidizing endosymbiont of Gigantopelta aegis]|uniref:STAS domain-containing protein n=1 Tax=sulfur-oxidizing endosymbiont of Gigantopelta aegis TaxID=2794934 RepID=UPI0018DE037D